MDKYVLLQYHYKLKLSACLYDKYLVRYEFSKNFEGFLSRLPSRRLRRTDEIFSPPTLHVSEKSRQHVRSVRSPLSSLIRLSPPHLNGRPNVHARSQNETMSYSVESRRSRFALRVLCVARKFHVRCQWHFSGTPSSPARTTCVARNVLTGNRDLR